MPNECRNTTRHTGLISSYNNNVGINLRVFNMCDAITERRFAFIIALIFCDCHIFTVSPYPPIIIFFIFC